MGVQTSAPFANTYSLDFDGVDDYLDLGASSTVADSGQFTLSFWIKGTSQSAGARYLFSADYYNLNTFWTIQNTELYWRNINNGYKLLSANLLDGDWHHILIIWNPDGANSTIRCFTDGANEVNVATDHRYAPGWNGGAYQGGLQYIGNRGGGTFPGFNGNIDEFAVWNDDQSANVSTIYNGGVPNDLTDLSPDYWLRMGDNGSYKSPQWLIPSNENKDKVSNYSFEFDGVNDYVDCGDSIGTSFGENYTGAIAISVWFKADVTSGDDGILQFTGSTSIGEISVAVYGNDLEVRVKGSLEASGTFSDTSSWHHVLVNLIAPTGANQVYLDGSTFDSTFTYSSGGLDLDAENFYIGYYGGSRYWNGKIDEVAIFNTDQTSNVATLYNGGTPTSLPSGAVAHYKMGEQANFTSNWLVNNSALDNYSKRSFSFDGVDDKIELSPPTTHSADISVSFWMKAPPQGTTNIFGGSGIFQYFGSINTSGKLYIYDTGGSIAWKNVVSGAFDDTWHHIVVTRDSATNTIKGYKDSVLASTTVFTNAFPSNIISRIASFSTVRFYEGLLNEVCLYSSTIDQAKINEIYNGGTPTTISGAVAHWRMGENASFNGTNWTVPDNVGSNTGTSNAMTVDDLVGEAPNYSGGGISSGMTIEDRVGDAPNSENNALSFNMDKEDRTTDVPT